MTFHGGQMPTAEAVYVFRELRQVRSHPDLVALCDPYDCGINAFFAPGARLPATTCLFLEQEEPKTCQVQMWRTKKGTHLKTNMELENALRKRKDYRKISTNHQFLSSSLVFSGVLRKSFFCCGANLGFFMSDLAMQLESKKIEKQRTWHS